MSVIHFSQRRAKRWPEDETAVGMHAAHRRKDVLNGKHSTYGGSEEARTQAWEEVARKYALVFSVEIANVASFYDIIKPIWRIKYSFKKNMLCNLIAEKMKKLE